MGLLENLAGGFVMLVLASLVFLVIGFLGHATGSDTHEPSEPSPIILALSSIGFLGIGIWWGYYAWASYHDGEGWYWIAGMAFVAFASVMQSFQTARAALGAKTSPTSREA